MILATESTQSTPRVNRMKLIHEHLPKARVIAHVMARRIHSQVPFEEILSAATLGLIEAADKFDMSKGVQFRSYADARIKGAVLDHLRSLDWLPRSIRELSRRVESTRAWLEQDLGRPVSNTEVAEELGIDVGRIDDTQICLDLMERSTPLGECADSEKSMTGNIGASQQETPFDSVMRREAQETLRRCIDKLPERSKLVLDLYYFKGMKMRTIGEVLRVQESRVSQLHHKALRELKSLLDARLGLREARKLMMDLAA